VQVQTCTVAALRLSKKMNENSASTQSPSNGKPGTAWLLIDAETKLLSDCHMTMTPPTSHEISTLILEYLKNQSGISEHDWNSLGLEPLVEDLLGRVEREALIFPLPQSFYARAAVEVVLLRTGASSNDLTAQLIPFFDRCICDHFPMASEDGSTHRYRDLMGRMA